MKLKRILSFLALLLILLLVGLLLPFGRYSATLFTLSTHDSRCAEVPEVPMTTEVDEALQQGNEEEAWRLARQSLAQAADSDAYYGALTLLARYYFATMQADSFLHCNQRLAAYLQRCEGQATPARQLLQVEREMQMGVYEAKMVGRMDSAQQHNMQALGLLQQLRDCAQPGHEPQPVVSRRLVVLVNIADAYKQMGRYDQTVAYFRRAMELGDSVGMGSSMRITVAIGVASAYAAMHSFTESAQWWQRAAALKPQMQRQELFHYLNNRGNDYYLQERYAESLQCFLELDSLLRDDPNMLWERMFEHANLSDVYIHLGRTDEALPLLGETEPFFREQNQLIPLYYLITQRIDLALRQGRTAEALRLAGQEETPQWMIPEQVVLRQQVLMRLYEQTGQWQQYAQTMASMQQLKDSLAGDNMKMRFSAALMDYEHEKQMLDKQRQIEEKEIMLRWATAMTVAALLVLTLLTIIFVQKQHERRLREQGMRSRIMALRMETVRNRITPHFISNALSAEMLAQMDGREVDLDTLVQLLHRGIELTGCEQTTLADELEFISFYCSIESRSIGPDFCYEAVLAPDVDSARVMLPSMSVQIFVENALKHGLKRRAPQPGQHRTVRVSASRQGEGTLVEVTDNGTGLPEDRQRNERTGLKVLRQTIHLLNEQQAPGAGHMDFGMENCTHPDGQKGCRSWIYLPDHFEYTLKDTENGK